MTPSQFIGQNVHFAVSLFAALACFTGGWLYFDAWNGRRQLFSLVRWMGFFLLAAGLLMDGITWGDLGLINLIAAGLKLAGYSCMIIAHLMEPLQPRPKTDGPLFSSAVTLGSLGVTLTPFAWLTLALPIGSLTTAGLLWRRATTGLERHLKPLAYSFTIIGLSDVLAITTLWQTSNNPLLQPLVAVGGPVWIVQQAILLAGAAMLTWWIWHYLTKRLLTQIFMMSTSLTVAIVLLTTMSITTLLYNSLQRDSLVNLETAGKVLDYALASKTAETQANAEVIAQNNTLAASIAAGNHAALTTPATDILVKKSLSEVILTGDDGQVLVRASDPDRYGDSLSDDTLIRRALTGTTSTGITTRPGVLAPALLITTAIPVRFNGGIAGAALTSVAIDNAFVDGIKRSTSLDSAVYSGNIRTATTLTNADGTSRAIGIKETNSAVTSTTLDHGQTWRGPLSLSNQPYLATYLPLKDADNEIIGMLFVGQPQNTLLSTAQNAIHLTFAAATAWLLIMMLPVYFVSRRIVSQLQ